MQVYISLLYYTYRYGQSKEKLGRRNDPMGTITFAFLDLFPSNDGPIFVFALEHSSPYVQAKATIGRSIRGSSNQENQTKIDVE